MLYDVAPRDGYDPEIALLVAVLEDGTRKWRKEIGRVGKETLAWQPFEGSHSIGALILHMVEVEAWWFETVGSGRELSEAELKELMSADINQYSVSWPTPPKKTLSYFLALQDRYRARSLETLKSFKADQEVGFKGSTANAFTLRWIVHHVANHEAYHAGQAVYLKLLHEKTHTQREVQSET
jgi:uncharacterized damage-inducible protein DinB